MIFFWLIPMALIVLLAFWMLFRLGAKRPPAPGESRLDEARR